MDEDIDIFDLETDFLKEPNDPWADFAKSWRALPHDIWDRPPETWNRGWPILQDELRALPHTVCKSDIQRFMSADEAAWFEAFFEAIGKGMTRASLATISRLFQDDSFPKLDPQRLGIRQRDVRIFLRAGAELGDRDLLCNCLAHLTQSRLENNLDSGRRLVGHLLDCQKRAQSEEPERVANSVSMHVVFHEVDSDPKDASTRKALTRFTELVDVALPVVGRADADMLETSLSADAPWLGPAIQALSRRIDASLLGWSGLRLAPLLLTGPPGAGKTWLAQRLGELLGLPALVISAAGSRDNMAIKGTARGWASERPGLLVDFIVRHRVANPLVVVDEIDKASPSSHNGNLLDTLHQMLEPENARQWTDEYLLGRCDLSRVSWIATANNIAQLPPSLLSRFQVVDVTAPGPEHRGAMLHSVLRQIAREQELGFDLAEWLDEAEWRLLERNAKTPRHARRMMDALLGYKTRELRGRPH